MQMAWGLFALSLVAGWHDTARGKDPALVNEKKMQATGSMVMGVGFDGEFYPPVGLPKKLGVLVPGGSDGGIPSRRAKVIAENGFPVLALAYFKTERTPQYLDMIPLEYFDEPIEWLKKSTYTQGGRIAVLGKLNTGELRIGGAAKEPAAYSRQPTDSISFPSKHRLQDGGRLCR